VGHILRGTHAIEVGRNFDLSGHEAEAVFLGRGWRVERNDAKGKITGLISGPE